MPLRRCNIVEQRLAECLEFLLTLTRLLRDRIDSKRRSPPLLPRLQLERAARAFCCIAVSVGVTLVGFAVLVRVDAASAQQQVVAIGQIALGQIA